MKKLTVMFLAGVICLLGVTSAIAKEGEFNTYTTLTAYEKLTGKKIEKFSEAPALRVKVAAGELPPVEERLPEEPFVIAPLEGQEIGHYGGRPLRLMSFSSSAGGWYPGSQVGIESLGMVDRRCKEIIPNIAKGWEFSENGKVFTLYLRKGLKWSDGVPFTADDILFWWEDKILNDEVTPVKPKDFMPGGKLMKVEKIDDFTVRFSLLLNLTIRYFFV